ncbi:MAG: hypothetical protein ACFE9N_11675 [Promethearchaeota archaeon]
MIVSCTSGIEDLLADELGEQLCAVVLCDKQGDFPAKTAKYKTDKVYLVENPLLTDYNTDISQSIIEKYKDLIINRSQEVAAILILDYGLKGIFEDLFIQKLMHLLKENYKNVPIIVRPTKSNYYLYENVELIKMNLQKALDTFSIDCCNETSITIAGKRILNSAKCKNVLLNYLELESFLFSKENERVEKISPILHQPVRSYVAVGSVIMATLGLSIASGSSILDGAKLSLYAAALTATCPPVEFYTAEKLQNFISNIIKNS